jgi:hypothetical protein
VVLGCGDGGEQGGETEAATTQKHPTGLEGRLATRISELLHDRGLDPSLSDCAVTELVNELDDAELRRALGAIRRSGDVPTPLLELAAAAGESCAER